jgi:UDP-N-acetylmuramate dehydrogenase
VNASGDASPADVLALEKRIVDTVQERFGITLSPEVEHL